MTGFNMICDVCRQQKATVHLTEIINEQVTKLNLCEYCAKKKGAQMEKSFGIADLLQGLAEEATKTLTPMTQKVKCDNCGMSFDEFKKIGRLGCATCYTIFSEHLSPLLKRVHGANEHTGKIAARAPQAAKKLTQAGREKLTPGLKKASEIQVLKFQLKKAIENEAYEEAAVLRDKIKNVESRDKKK